MLLKIYVAGVAVAAATAGAIAALVVPGAHTPSIAALAFMTLLLWLTEFLQVRQYHYRGHGISYNLIEGILAPIIYACSGSEVVLVCALGLSAAEVLRRTGLMKTVFNVTQWVFAAATGSLVFHTLAGAHASPSRAIAGIAVATISMSLVNQVTLAGVLSLAVRESGEEQSRADLRSGLVGRLISNGASLVTGVTLVAAYRWSPWLLVLGGVFVVALDAAGRAHAHVRADMHRLEGLQSATHALATSLDMHDAIPRFLRETRIGFEARAVQLVLFGQRSCSVYTCNDEVDPSRPATSGRHELAQLLRSATTEPVRLSADSGDKGVAHALGKLGYQRAVAVPLVSTGQGADVIGMLLLYDRRGVEGFESGELKVAAALARELVGFLDRVDLMQEIDEERKKLTDILESTSDGILTVDAGGTVTSWNNGLIEMTGYSSDEMVGTRHLGLLRARDGVGRDVLLERWHAETGDLPAELQIVTSGGHALWLSCSYSRIPAAEGRSEVLVVVARNITQQRELERLKDDFVAVVSHELRTPLVPIKGWAQTLINRGDRLNDDQRRTAVQSILAQAQKLESLVLNILEASRIESGRSDGDGVADVASIAMRLVEDTLSARPDRAVRVRPPAVPCQVRGSAVWVERAVANLLANAIKYSPDDEPVDVAISVEGDDVLVSVTDRGPGIATEAQERIFERFERLEETRTQTGTGLGLYITRRLARAMGGEVSVSSVPGAGSTFLLRLPVAPVTRVPEQRIVDSDNVVNLR